MKTKQNKTKQNTFTLSTLVSKLQLAKPTLYILLVSLLSALSSSAFAAPPPGGFPDGFYTEKAEFAGYTLPFVGEDGTFWEVENNSGCDFTFTYYLELTLSTGDVLTQPLLTSTGLVTLDELRAIISAQGLDPESFRTSRLVVKMILPGQDEGVDLYPGNPYIRIDTPCGCVSVRWDFDAHKIVIEKCGPIQPE